MFGLLGQSKDKEKETYTLCKIFYAQNFSIYCQTQKEKIFSNFFLPLVSAITDLKNHHRPRKESTNGRIESVLQNMENKHIHGKKRGK